MRVRCSRALKAETYYLQTYDILFPPMGFCLLKVEGGFLCVVKLPYPARIVNPT